ncbi:hypothetical protein EIK77_009920 [Talaromyces pinophilus]|jgi:adaptin ear-binding coat-associated protein 1/2|uniref:Adaptin ear-binding coat-associated protein n=1 Tax=Talaromyces pinophilus TaxID=128442 RepID=A0A6V8GZK9_TALPI|nr:Adaptin ear-binding coat-associated protein 2 [Talaromyces pinophilus]KAI7976689.1 hypothetical protein EIK77_009920 [Talaromyces pinophilus]PCH01569.1 Adaptin ear-binding coat-associated protein 1 NECAP-1 [Penicillium occitanis (nom. inval.)]PCH04091.1 hypothetical protein PENOC_035300 [Penicillium occitanis (nom. inval.)]GAM34471.1 adaptin ear-binding coat-associated protein [Talaromyces pinophilus]
MSAINPATGEPLPADALQRVLFVTPLVHVYSVPPLTSMKGYSAAEWTVPNPQTGQTRQIFSARLRILETAIHDKVSADILLEDPQNGTLFAAAPLTDANSVDYVTDSSRFFVLRVVGEGRKALLGIGFEERSDAFDFGVALQEAKKILGIRDANSTEQQKPTQSSWQGNNTLSSSSLEDSSATTTPKDYSLKPGQTISINSSRRRPAPTTTSPLESARDEEQALFSIPPPPPPGAATSFINTTPTSDQTGRRKRPTSAIIAADSKPFLGFDDSATFD